MIIKPSTTSNLDPEFNTIESESTIGTSRRSLLKGLITLGATTLVAPTFFIPSFSRANDVEKMGDKALTLYNTNTGEALKKCVFWQEGKFIKESQADLNKFFRDFRTGEQKDIDPDLLLLLHNMSEKLETTEPFHLISGYRSPKTNAALRKKNSGVARKSQHPLGKAADIYVPGRSLKKIQALAKSFKVGGVGRYSRFVHVDTGPVRYW